MSKIDKSVINQVRSSLSQYGIHAKKRIGQNFLIDESVLTSIIDAADLQQSDIVVEVGPGLGILTEQIASRVKSLFSIEIDRVLASKLKQKFSHINNVHIVNGDILDVNIAELIGNVLVSGYKVVANLPYYITSPILNYFVRRTPRPSLMVVMVQKEVGESILASQGKMSVLSLNMRIHTVPSLVSYVSPASFFPRPKVYSAILRFDFLERPAVDVENYEAFINFLHSGFASPRKLLKNSLAIGLNISTNESALLVEKSGIKLDSRPEALTLAQWGILYKQAITEGIIGKC